MAKRTIPKASKFEQGRQPKAGKADKAKHAILGEARWGDKIIVSSVHFDSRRLRSHSFAFSDQDHSMQRHDTGGGTCSVLHRDIYKGLGHDKASDASGPDKKRLVHLSGFDAMTCGS
ncbi:hypothetical protein NLI96_g426 [Meripilus lineatus]|uniref:Uncharacterized protein n=1 Tax=Meripilus lineatus TaxID=2056292 RepID=A0AAD5VEW1_9APHY|nr:hypothetical protein NLI96_g426 [Physisporinus lineatus]